MLSKNTGGTKRKNYKKKKDKFMQME